ncbi:ubiquinol-cytochrome C reductase hinge protein-domain-containing protein [Suillus subaureus]|uniref:Ubiquinol-cytochrome C reductase hinge protein-domain-containing protein n=1 Tax=Suillus subaureus TaxID=48587 RepID=A0A9P7J819_9AGAM|nr:ubiquinol-cytochrome C reductase hinge protein-domain-containing protein [Suillus subaureus]KAG1807167.1 ubiquinol-cytochrome C reductase hinge protein-domain-containing protein [Suillus subaureus]
MSVTSFFSSFFNTVHCDAPEEKRPENEMKEEEVAEVGEPSKGSEEEEEVEAEDVHPIIMEECKNSAACASLTRHFEHCQEKVQSGQGFKGEDCVEEFMMHCADACAAPKLFSKLK